MTVKTKAKCSYPVLKYGAGSAATTLVILGVIFSSGALFLLGIIVGYIWAYKYQKSHPSFRLWWWILVALVAALIVFIAITDIVKF